MTDNTNNEVPEISEITPLPTPPVGMPRVPITLFNVWTWSTPVIPQFYWNVYSAEQRIKQICKEIGRIEAYLDYAATTANEAHLDMANKINEVEQKLSKQIADLTIRLTTEVNRLDALISAETAAREAGDEKLEAEIVKETTERKTADAKLTADLEKEVQDRQDADETLHTEISAETTARTHADDVLHSEISAEVTARGEAISALTTRVATEESTRQAEDAKLAARIDATNSNVQNNANAIITETEAREAADSAINEALATKLVRDDLRSSGKITLTPGEGNTLTIGDSFEADFDALQSAIAGLQASLASETDERRNDDNELWQAVNQRLERGNLLAGDGIEVYNDPDQSTVTVSAKVTETELSAVEAKADEAKETADQAKAAAAEAKATAEGKLSTVSVGDGLTGEGTWWDPVTLTIATSDLIGGVKVGEGLTVGVDGTLSATGQGGSGLTEVAHDSSLKGTGASDSPLGVVAAPQGALTAGEQGLAVNAGEGLSISDNRLVAEVTQAELDAVNGKAEAAQAAATEAGSKAQAATEAATQAGSKAEAASTAASEAGSKAEAAQSAAEAAQAAAEGKLSTVAVSGPLTGDGTAGSPLEVSTATATSAGVITEDRVKELAGSASITAEKPLKVEGGKISLRSDYLDSPISVSSTGHLQVARMDTDPGHADAYGVVSPNVIRSLFTFDEPLSKGSDGRIALQLDYPLSVSSTGLLQVEKMPTDGGHTDSYGVVSQNVLNALIEAKVNEMVKAEALNS